MNLSAIRVNLLQWLLIAVCLAAPAAGHSAVKETERLTASRVFAEIPLEVLDMLRPSTRLDMLDYYAQADSMLVAVDALGGSSSLQQVTDDYLKLSVTPVSTLEIKILPYGKRQLVMTVYTTGGDDMAKDSEVRFFDSGMQPLPAGKFMKAPTLTDFFNLKGSGISEKELKEKVPFIAVEYTSGPGETPLEATLTSLRVISQEERDLLTAFLIPTLTASWKKSYRFTP
ncbi:MAG: DUF3256 family protein [Muribaculaceae bacterium]|nr:DUF3256 family protein [Muribaculaceae bacterium]